MFKFYIIYKDNSEISGEVTCRNTFIERFINPSVDDIYTYQIWHKEEKDLDDDSSDCSSIFDGTPDWIRMMD